MSRVGQRTAHIRLPQSLDWGGFSFIEKMRTQCRERIIMSKGERTMAYEMIDFNKALEQLDGSMKLYSIVLKGFKNRYAQVDEDIQKRIDQGDLEDARRLAHSIKGLCGNLGSAKCLEKALNLEMAIRDEGDMALAMAEFRTALYKTQEDIERILKRYYA